MQPVVVHWKDAVGMDGWVSLEDIINTELSEHVTVGFMVVEGEDHITLTMSYDNINEDNYGAFVVIPRINIIKIERLFTPNYLIH